MTRSTFCRTNATRRLTGVTVLLLLLMALMYLPNTAHATYSLPASQSVDWTIPYIGVKGDIPARTTVYTSLSPSGGDDTSAIQNALKSCPAGQVVYLKAGTFTISANINIPSNVTLRGAGRGVTTIAGATGMGGSSLISFKAGSGYASTSYTSASLAKGQTVVTLNTSPGWSVGALVLIDVANSSVTETTVTNVGNNGTCTWCGRSSGSRSMGQVNRVAAISGSTVTFETPLAWNFAPSATQFTAINSVTNNAGLENISINNQNSGSTSQTGNGGTVVMNNASNCWMVGVELNGSWLTMLRMMNTYGCTVRKSVLHEGVPAAFSPGCAAYQTSRAYGIWIGPGSNNLIENNQLYHLAMPVKYDEPTSYNVMAYNVITNTLYSPNPSWNQASIEFHGAHPMMNLFESNIVTGRLLADTTWGSSSHNTFFRNKSMIPSGMTGALWDVCLQSNAHNYNFVGNVLGTPRDESVYQINNVTVPSSRAIYQTGYGSDGDGSASGNDANVAATLLTQGNWDSVTGGAKWISGSDQVLPASLYLKSMPSWWGSAPFPAIGPDVSPNYPSDAYTMTLGGGNTPFDAGPQSTTSYTISAGSSTGGSISPSGTTTLNAGASQSYTITPLSGYSISSVTVDGTSVGAVSSYSFTSVAANHTITANFAASAPTSYSISASAGTGGSITPSGSATVTAGGSATYSIAPAAGYKVAAVTVDGTSVGAVSSYSFSNVTANHTISASFAAQSYTITASAAPGGSITPSGATTVAGGGSQTYSIVPQTGYAISGVTVDGVSVGAVSSYSFSSIAANHSISASFVLTTYTITASAGTGGTITPSGSATVTGNSNQGYTITPASGYAIASVVVDGTSVGAVTSYTFSSIAANHTIQANFVAKTFTIAASAGTGGSITPSGSATVTAGASQTYSIAPATGYSIAGVSVDGVSVGAVTSYTFSSVSVNHTIAASFSAKTTASSASYAVNCAGAKYTDATGLVYNADVNYSGGSVGTTTSAIGGTSDPTLYQSERYGNFSYSVPLTNGTYNVTLKFAETYFSSTGQRVFNVAVNGSTVISNLDLYAKAGKNTAYDVVVPVSVTNGTLSIQLTSVVNNAEIRAIKVVPSASIAPSVPVFAVDAGGASYKSPTSGISYAADSNYTGGSVGTTTSAISGTSDPTLYQSERYGNFSYNVPVTNGTHNVTLKFAESYFSSTGQRVFSVSANGSTVISNLDIYAKAGKNAAYDVTFPVNVTNGAINLGFVASVNNAEVRGIVIQ